MPRLLLPRLLLQVALMAPSICTAQVTGSFSLEKSSFAPGEPVFLSFTLHNDGTETAAIRSADPYSFCSGYKIRVTRDATTPKAACFQSYGGSCISGGLPLAPGASHTERILLNYRNAYQGYFTSVSLPGDYTIDASREIAYGPGGKNIPFPTRDHATAHQEFHLRVDDALELPPGIYTPYVQQLESKDSQARREAARTLATIAPPTLEPLLLTFATSKYGELKQFAPLALFNLSTKTSLAALAQMLLDNKPGTYEFVSAAQKLGETHDAAWFPVLLEVADQQGSMYLSYAAESGGDAAIPALLVRLRSPQPGTRVNAIRALGRTGSRAAVPLLISLLPSNSTTDDAKNDAYSANEALMALTHLYAEQDANGASISGWHNRWQNWWLTSGQTATIYKPDDCAANTKLP